VESGSADDGQGNITGQAFDFVGEPIPALSGRFSNLGQIYVNNDAGTLYLGIEQAMIYPGHDIYLFVESPGLNGVTGLAGLGNGLIDSDGEGADGLDFLENLSFHQFTPGIGCILGDEFADGQDRGFGRQGMSHRLGQGIFYLEPGFGDVPGIRLQQYNLSPQRFPRADEQNANFIEMVIPFAALGNLRPGDVIEIAAVVGGHELDLIGKRRRLDNGFLGEELTWEETGEMDSTGWMGPVRLAGVKVQLADDPVRPFRVSISSEDPNRYRIAWPGVIGRKYQVQYTTRLDEPFRNARSADWQIIATGPEVSFEGVMGDEEAGGMRIYRVMALE
jgi:hypothetical protein